MTQDDQDAIRILSRALQQPLPLGLRNKQNCIRSWDLLMHAIRHLAYPDRDIYPKTRRGTKGAPIVRK